MTTQKYAEQMYLVQGLGQDSTTHNVLTDKGAGWPWPSLAGPKKVRGPCLCMGTHIRPTDFKKNNGRYNKIPYNIFFPSFISSIFSLFHTPFSFLPSHHLLSSLGQDTFVYRREEELNILCIATSRDCASMPLVDIFWIQKDRCLNRKICSQ